MRVVVGTDGRPTEVKVERGVPGFDEVAIKTLRTWKYEPTVVDGSPRRVTVYEPLAFFLSNKNIAEFASAWALGQRPKDPGALEVKLWAVSALTVLLPQERAAASKGLEALASDADERVAKAAQTALDAAKAASQ
jgi:TonB family protein